MMKQDIDRLIDRVGVAQASSQRCVAAILFTYRCSIACKHCLFGCAGDRPDVAMAPDQCAEYLGLLHETGRVVHIAGGEAMLYWDAMSEAISLAHRQGNAPHFIETNCSFASSDAVVRERFTFMAAHGVRGILASADPYHQAFVPPEHFLRVRRLTKEIFGAKNFFGSESSDPEIRDLPSITRDPALLREHVRQHPPSMVGTARKELAQYLDRFSPQDNKLPAWSWRGPTHESDCITQFKADTLWELHIDPYGNIQTNCGIILGKLPEATPAGLLAAAPEKANRFVETVCAGGARGLAELARREHGFVLPEKVTQNCELCYLARAFLRAYHPDVFGPAEVYG